MMRAMFVQFFAAAGVLAVLTVVPGPDMAVVTKRAVSCGWRDGLRTAGGITGGLLVWGALAPTGLSPHLGMALLVLLHAAITAVWLGGYVMLLAKARGFFERAAVQRALDRVTGVVLIGFGVKVATTRP